MDERMEILEKIDKGELTPSEGAKLLDQLAREGTTASMDDTENDRMKILEGIEQGVISPEEGADKLKQTAPSAKAHSHAHHQNPGSPTMAVGDEEIAKWRNWWMIPFWIGSAIMIVSGLWMNANFQAAGANFWFYCAWLPMLLGLGMAIIGLMSQRSRWLHIRVKPSGNSGAHVALSFPLPIGLTSWLLRTFGGWIPGLGDTALDEVIVALGKETGETPFFIQVDDDEDGEQVEIFIG